MPEMPKQPKQSDPLMSQVPPQPVQPEAPAQPTQPSFDADVPQFGGQIDEAAGFTPPGGSGAGGTKPGAGPSSGADYGFGGAVQGALGAGREFMGQLGDSFGGLGQRAQDATSRITSGVQQRAGDLMQGARDLFSGRGQPSATQGNPRGPGFEAAVADMPAPPPPSPRGPDFDAAVSDFDQRMDPPGLWPARWPKATRMDPLDPAGEMQAGMGPAPPSRGDQGISAQLPGDAEREAREDALGVGMAMGGGPQEIPLQAEQPADPYADSRFREQMQHWDAINRGEVGSSVGDRGRTINPRMKDRAESMLGYYRSLEGQGDDIARKADADIRGGREVSRPTMNYMARRDEFESGRDPDAFSSGRSAVSEDLLQSGLREKLEAAEGLRA